jgi:hypothetical protein
MQPDNGGKNYPDEDFFGYTDPWEPVLFPVLPGTQKKQEQEASCVDS